MIKINRPKAPKFLVDPKEKWQQEIEAAKIHYGSGKTETFVFKHYNEPEVKDELRKVFVKCAYCESNYGAVYDGDVEHFRPKGRINEKNPQTPGYYWLANDWDNLFLACQHCNQRRKYILEGMTKAEGYGKLDQFPLNTETERLLKPQKSMKREEAARLLINPCIDEPSEHFEYESSEGMIVPITHKGEVSLKVYVLTRPLLAAERKKQFLLLMDTMELVRRQLKILNKNPDDRDICDIFDKMMDSLLQFASPETSYAGMSRFFISKFLNENGLTNT